MKNSIQYSLIHHANNRHGFTHKYTALITVLTCALISSNVFAKHHHDGKYKHRNKHSHSSHTHDYAKVTSVKPIYKAIEYKVPIHSCDEAPARHGHHGKSSYTPAIVGGLIGGALGNTLGHNKSNKRVGAIIGTLLGASIASDFDHQAYHHKQKRRYKHNRKYNHRGYKKQCSTRYDYRYKDKLVGYHVNYRYRGQHYRTRTKTHPGSHFRIKH